MAGVDVGAKTVIKWKKSGGAPRDPKYRVVVDALFRRGRHGQKIGAGYYRYEGRTPIPDPEFDALARSLAEEHQISRRNDISDNEIVERLFYSLINGGCRLLEEGIAYRPDDIDVVWVAGYGFPRELGGPMYWAERIGLARIVTRLEHYGKICGNDYWAPSALLARAAPRNLSLSEAVPKSSSSRSTGI
jgi:3-hydroxyacyl-CoA dehydrogenase